MTASLIIVTHNRAHHLIETIFAIQKLQIPVGLDVELLVVDNASTDHTAEVAQSGCFVNLPARYVYESRKIQTIGRNRGMAETTGDIIIFTDDDVRPPVNWLDEMCASLAEGKCDAVSGGVKIAPHLVRPWMTPMHRTWLASTELLTDPSSKNHNEDASSQAAPRTMVGASMAFMRDVLHKVPRFDPELGPGASGFGDDHLFAMQLKEAGYRIHNRTDLCLEHHFDPSRLSRRSWLNAAERRGASHAYVGHHWSHWRCRVGKLRLLRESAKLIAWRACNPTSLDSDECSEEELHLVFNEALVKAHVRQSTIPRKYERHGLVKLQYPPSQ